MDTRGGVHWFFEDDFVIRGFNLSNQSFGTHAYVDLDECKGGGSCLDEWVWDAMNERIVAVGMGFQGTNSIVTVSQWSGKIERVGALEFDELGLPIASSNCNRCL